MNRREALAALVAIPGTPRLSVARLAPDDVIVVECDQLLTHQGIEHIHAAVSRVWPGRRVLVLEKGLTLKIVGAP